MVETEASGGASADGEGGLGQVLAEIGRLRSEVSLMAETMAKMEATLSRTRLVGPVARGDDEPPHGAYRIKVIEVLKAAYPERLTASEVAGRVAALLPVRVHPKTPGMTLTRLKRDGLIGRDGRTWYWLPPAAPAN